MNILKRLDTWVLTIASALLILLSEIGTLPFGRIEVFGFVSGAICVWLVVKASVWNWPIGLINAGFFVVLFYDYKLFADMALQLVFIAMGLLGWWTWVRGGEGHTKRKITLAVKRPFEAVSVAVATALFTYFMMGYLGSVGDVAPFRDALTTGLSLAATWMQVRKYVESWLIWIVADLIYIPLYHEKGLTLTGILYIAFLVMCFVGLRDWYRARGHETTLLPPAPATDYVPVGAGG